MPLPLCRAALGCGVVISSTRPRPACLQNSALPPAGQEAVAGTWLTLALASAGLYYLYRTTTADPGFLPRNTGTLSHRRIVLPTVNDVIFVNFTLVFRLRHANEPGAAHVAALPLIPCL